MANPATSAPSGCLLPSAFGRVCHYNLVAFVRNPESIDRTLGPQLCRETLFQKSPKSGLQPQLRKFFTWGGGSNGCVGLPVGPVNLSTLGADGQLSIGGVFVRNSIRCRLQVQVGAGQPIINSHNHTLSWSPPAPPTTRGFYRQNRPKTPT